VCGKQWTAAGTGLCRRIRRDDVLASCYMRYAGSLVPAPAAAGGTRSAQMVNV